MEGQNKANILELLEFILTKRDLDIFLNTVKKVLDSTYSSQENVENILNENLSIDLSDAVINSAQDSLIDLKNSSSTRQFFQEILDTLSNQPTVDITLAFTPSRKFAKKIAKWFRKEVDSRTLLNIKTDEDIIAGSIIGKDGRITDVSFKKLILEQ